MDNKVPVWLDFWVLLMMNIATAFLLALLAVSLIGNQRQIDKNYSDMTRLESRLHDLLSDQAEANTSMNNRLLKLE